MIYFVPIDMNQIAEYIKISWEGDSQLSTFYDKSLESKSLDDMVNDTHKKIFELSNDDNNLKLFGLEENKAKIGFCVLSDKFSCLYSFGVNHRNRTKENLSELFSFIKKELNDSFFCVLNNCNSRAINWLKKCGMVEDDFEQKNIVYLKY